MVYQWPTYMLFGVAAVTTLLLIKRRPKSAPGLWCLVSTLLLSVYVIGRAAVSPVPYFARMDIAMVLAALITYLIFALHLSRSRYRLVFVGTLLTLSCADIFVGLYQIFQDKYFSILPGTVRAHPTAASGFYDNHNHFGGFLLIGVAFVIALSFFGKMGPKMRVIVLFLVPVMLGGIAISASRGAMVSVACGMLVFVLLGLLLAKRLYHYEFKKIVIIVAIIGAVVTVPTVYIGKKMVEDRSDLKQTSDMDGAKRGTATLGMAVRKINWSLAYAQWQENPVVGEGSRMYDVYSVANWPASMKTVHGDPEFAHNDYLQMLAEYGAVGFALMLLFIFVHIGSGLQYLLWHRRERSTKRSDNGLALCLGALVVLTAYAAHSMMDFNLHLPVNLIPVAFAFAILANPGGSRSSGRKPAPKQVLWGARAVLPVAGLVLLIAGLLFSIGEWHMERARKIPLSEYAEVIERTDDSLKHDGGNFYAHQLRGTALMLFGFNHDVEPEAAGLMARAIEDFERALELNPYDIFSTVGLGRCLDVLGEHDQAEQKFAAAVKLGPRSSEARYRYGYHLLARGEELVEEDLVAAIELMERAEESMVWARSANERYVRGGRVDVAVVEVRRALSFTYDVYGRRYLGAAEIFRAQGDTDSELVQLEKAKHYFDLAAVKKTDRGADFQKVRRKVDERLAVLKAIRGIKIPE